MDKLKIINSMPLADFSVAGGEVEYVIVKENNKILKALREMGMTDDDYENMTDEEGYLDLSYFAFNKLGANWWSRKDGFCV